METWRKDAEDFLNSEKQFHLGFLPSEARNPLTANLDTDFREQTEKGVRTLLACDRVLVKFFRDAIRRPEYHAMIAAMKNARNIIFSGCGATGRLAILLESAWNELHPDMPKVYSIQTGGDFALVRSVENFEDYPEGGRKQVEDLAVNAQDVLIGITATGETASILGTAKEAALRGAQVFMIICVPTAIAASRLERCRELYAMKNVTAIDMPIPGMAVTGSTRMQSSTIELLVAASALETAWEASTMDYTLAFEKLLDSLENSASAIAACIEQEEQIYRNGELIDYNVNDLLIDVLSDTTERSPTFMIPPYKMRSDVVSAEPWAMARDLSGSTEEIWKKCLRRSPRCIEWTEEEYHQAGLSVLLKKGIPPISAECLYQITIGNETLHARAAAHQIQIINDPAGPLTFDGKVIGGKVTATPLRLFEHLRMKLTMNLISTGTMVRLGRVKSNYMIQLAISNKKLIDRACRIISELCHIDYETACYELFRTRAEIEGKDLSPVAETLRRLEAK